MMMRPKGHVYTVAEIDEALTYADTRDKRRVDVLLDCRLLLSNEVPCAQDMVRWCEPPIEARSYANHPDYQPEWKP